MVNLFMEKSLSRKDEQKKIYPSIEKIKRDFKFSPKYSIEKGLEKTIKFYKKSFK